jgi:hypothetical protein
MTLASLSDIPDSDQELLRESIQRLLVHGAILREEFLQHPADTVWTAFSAVDLEDSVCRIGLMNGKSSLKKSVDRCAASRLLSPYFQ